MYIKKVTKSNKTSKKEYTYLRLVENIRTEHGPRQRLILNLGTLNIQPDNYKELANCIEAMLNGQTSLFSNSPRIQRYASQAVDKITQKKAKPVPPSLLPDVRPIDINSIETSTHRSIGPEYLCHSIWHDLKISKCLQEAQVSAQVIPLLETLVVGRAVSPGSEIHTKYWADMNSAIYELSGKPLRHSLNSFYRGNDILLSCKEALENHLAVYEKDLFCLTEKICFFDLTNAHFEGAMKKNNKARFGRSKQKRSDCRLLTLALVINEDGFIKYSKLYPGNQYEGDTLADMITDLGKRLPSDGLKPTIVMDAGIALKENISYLQERGYHYIVVNRGKSPFTQEDILDLCPIEKMNTSDITVSIKRYTDEVKAEVFILCKSVQKEKKEEAIRTRQEELFLEQLKNIQSGLDKKGRVKKYYKIVERIGRLREKYPKASKKYEVEVLVEQNEKKEIENLSATHIKWVTKTPPKDADNFDGCYVLRSDRLDLSDNEIWNTYTMLTRIEKAFRDMKSSLGLRPNFHQLEHRADAHMFISVLAYHLIHSIEYRLSQKNDFRSWDTIRNVMSTHQRLTVECDEYEQNKVKGKHFIILCSKPEPHHIDVYKKLGLNPIPLEKKYYENL